jgi:hypothetical protein
VEIFILDALLREIDLVDGDNYESFIWTERYAEKGDFQIVALSTPAMKNRFVEDTLITIRDSKRIMRVNKIDEQDDVEKGKTLTISGFELVSVLEQRVSCSKDDGGSTNIGELLAITYFNGWTPLALINDMVWRICIPTSGWAISPGDNIPFLNDWHTTPGSLYPASNIPEPAPGGILWEQKLDSLYNAVRDVAQAYDLGFRLYKDPSTAKLYFESYNGVDRTTAQTVYPPIVFSSDMETLQNTTEYRDNLAEFNIVIAVYIYKNPEEGGYPESLTITGVASDPELEFSSGGFDQKTKVITISQLPEGMTDPTEIHDYLVQLANEELTRSKPSDIFDGEINQDSGFVYERDYYLGDILEIRSDNGGAAFMRVVEQIFKYDANGKAAYPSLITKESITPGTWRSWKYDVEWSEMGSGEYWENQ